MLRLIISSAALQSHFVTDNGLSPATIDLFFDQQQNLRFLVSYADNLKVCWLTKADTLVWDHYEQCLQPQKLIVWLEAKQLKSELNSQIFAKKNNSYFNHFCLKNYAFLKTKFNVRSNMLNFLTILLRFQIKVEIFLSLVFSRGLKPVSSARRQERLPLDDLSG